MTSFAQEAAQRMSENSLKWIKRMKVEEPDRAKYYCDHGVYIGSNRLFIYKCEVCNA